MATSYVAFLYHRLHFVVLALLAAAIGRGMRARTALALGLQQSRRRDREERVAVPTPVRGQLSAMWGVYDDLTREFLAVNGSRDPQVRLYSREEFLSMSRQDIRIDDEQPPVVPASACRGPGMERRLKEGWHADRCGLDVQRDCFRRPSGVPGTRSGCRDPKRAEEAPRQSEQRTRMIIDTALDDVISMTASVSSPTGARRRSECPLVPGSAEAMGQRMSDTIIPPRYRVAHDRGAQEIPRGDGRRVPS